MDYQLSRELQALSAEATEFARHWAAKCEIREDSWLRGVDREFSRELGERGWLGMCWPRRWGGGERSALERFVVVEALISNGAPCAASWFPDRQIGPTLLQFGTDEQRARFLAPMVAGEAMWGIGMSEPDAGSDVASIRTAATGTGDEWVINGQKVWTSGAADADWIYLIARTDPTAPPHRGLSEFIVDCTSPGVTIVPIRDMTDDRHFCEIYFEDVVVPESLRVGELNGAFGQVMRQMEHERGGIDRLCSNAALFRDVVEQVPLSDSLRIRAAELKGQYCIGRLMVLREVLGQAEPGYSAVTKTWCTEFEQRVAEFCVAALGPASLLSGPGGTLSARASRNICYAPGYTIMGGTTEILRNICGERLLGLPKV